MSEPAIEDKQDIFSSMLSHKTQLETDKSLHRMSQEGFALIGAAGETTSRVLSIATYHILANRQDMLPSLRKELDQVMPTPTSRPAIKELEQLPFLVSNEIPKPNCILTFYS